MKKIIIFLMFLGVATASQATIYYVKETPSGLGDGTSWANASDDLQAMIIIAGTGDTIWVAEGTYKPTHSSNNPLAVNLNINDRHNTFTLKDGVVILGGFPNTINPDLSNRNWAMYRTILSGDIGTANDSTDNAYHVVVADDLGSQTVLDGFFITGGYADSTQTVSLSTQRRGGGMYIYNSFAQFINLIIHNNYAQTYGGGIAIRGSSFPTFLNVLIHNNTARNSGGGVLNDAS
ncbi:MAG: hypothetical protein LBE13_15490, partial [Bacteroidales bacterium]|nr:hypothetical protein [Bacteroidales bacterium]